MDFAPDADLSDLAELTPALEELLGSAWTLSPREPCVPGTMTYGTSGSSVNPEQRTIKALTDIVNAAAAAEHLVQRGREAYDADEMLRFAAQAISQRIGEAAGRLPGSFVTELEATASWRAIRGIRNVLTHEYQRMDCDLLWRALAHRLPDDALRIRALHQRLRCIYPSVEEIEPCPCSRCTTCAVLLYRLHHV